MRPNTFDTEYVSITERITKFVCRGRDLSAMGPFEYELTNAAGVCIAIVCGIALRVSRVFHG